MLVPELAAASQRHACLCNAAATSQALEILYVNGILHQGTREKNKDKYMYKNVHEPVYLTNPQARSRSSTWTLPYDRKNAIIYEALIPCTVNAFQLKADTSNTVSLFNNLSE